MTLFFSQNEIAHIVAPALLIFFKPSAQIIVLSSLHLFSSVFVSSQLGPLFCDLKPLQALSSKVHSTALTECVHYINLRSYYMIQPL